jgi:COP9 signalosome complex subunit 2
MQLHARIRSYRQLHEIYQKSMTLKSAICHPRIMGSIREGGGIWHMKQKAWDKAQKEFLEAFRNYEDADCPSKIQCINYLLLANLMDGCRSDPFDIPEIAAYQNNPIVQFVRKFVLFHQKSDLKSLQELMNTESSPSIGNSLQYELINNLLFRLRSEIILQLLQKSTFVEFDLMQIEFSTDADQLERILWSLITCHRINGKIDRLRRVIHVIPDAAPQITSTAI